MARVSPDFESRAPLRVLFVVPTLALGGTEAQIAALCPQLSASGVIPVVFALRAGGPLVVRLRQAGIEVITPWRLPRPVQLLAGALHLWTTLAFRRIAVVHFFLPEAYLIGGVVSLGVPRLCRVMSRRSLNRYQQNHPVLARLERWLHARMDRITGNSNAVLDELRTEGADERRLRLIPNGVEVKSAGAGVSPAQAALPEGAFVIVTIANLHAYKGHELALRALARISDRLPQSWVYLCIGADAGHRDALVALTDELCLSDRVRWLGEVEDAQRWLSVCDLMVHPSQQEGLPNCILEAMWWRVPVVATAVGGVPDLIPSHAYGRLVPPDDTRALAEGILELSLDPQTRHAVAVEAYERASHEFSLSRCVREHCALYGSLTSAAGAG